MAEVIRHKRRGGVNGQHTGLSGITAGYAKWHLRAACRGPFASVFYPPAHNERRHEKRQREQRAKAICATCSVVAECLSYALDIREQHGIWGGLNEKERRKLLLGSASA